MTTYEFIQACKTGNFALAITLMRKPDFTLTHADCEVIMTLTPGVGGNYTLHHFTEFRGILVQMICKTKRQGEIKMDDIYIDYANISIYQDDGPKIDRDYLVNLGQQIPYKMKL